MRPEIRKRIRRMARLGVRTGNWSPLEGYIEALLVTATPRECAQSEPSWWRRMVDKVAR